MYFFAKVRLLSLSNFDYFLLTVISKIVGTGINPTQYPFLATISDLSLVVRGPQESGEGSFVKKVTGNHAG